MGLSKWLTQNGGLKRLFASIQSKAAIVCWLNPITSFAQITESDTLALQMRAATTGMWQSGNVEMLVVRSRFDVVAAPGQGNWAFKSQNNHLYQEFFRRKADDDFSSRNFLYYRPQARVYPFAMAFFSTNYRRKVELRHFAGLGLTWHCIRAKGQSVKLSLSGLYEQGRHSDSNYNLARYNGNPNIDLWRGTIYLAGQHTLKKGLRLFYDAYYQPAIDESANYRGLFDIGIDLQLWKGLQANVMYLFTHENVVVERIRQRDQLLTFGLSYSFSKSRSKP